MLGVSAKTVAQWIKEYEDVERSGDPDRRTRLWSLSMTMPEEALRKIAARPIVNGRVKRISPPAIGAAQ